MTIPEIAELRARLCSITEACGRASSHASRIEEILTDHAPGKIGLRAGDQMEIRHNTRDAYLEIAQLQHALCEHATWLRAIAARTTPAVLAEGGLSA